MKNKLITTIIFALGVCLWSLPAQNNLSLRLHYPLDNKSGIEKVRRQDGVVTGTVENYTDRFGNTSGAMIFSDNAYVSTPSMTSNIAYKSTGMTISFWIYVDESIEKQFGRYPWTDQDPVVRAFYAKKDGTVLFGFHRRADRAVLDRYTTDINGQTKSWNLWLWDPVNFTRRTGWYHIIIAYEPSRAFLYLFAPDGSVESCAHYFAIQDIPPATSDWGIGNNSGKSLILDDFKVYQGVASSTQARELHSNEAMPNGMYRIMLCADNTKFIHTYGRQTSGSTPLEILDADSQNDYHTYKWIFEPVSGKNNVYTIRLAYENMYMHLEANSASEGRRVELLGYDSQYTSTYEWYVEPTGDGYYFLRSNADRTKYLHTVGHSSEGSSRLEVLSYSDTYASTYKWRFGLLKTNYEIAQNVVTPGNAHEYILSDNTAIGMLPVLPVSGDPVPVRVGRGSYPSLLTQWKFFKSKDDSYRIYNAAQPSYNLHPEGRSIASGTKLQAAPYSSQYSQYYDFVVEKPNKYGRRIQVSPSQNQSLIVTATSNTKDSELTLQYGGEGKSNLFALYEGGIPNVGKQVYNLKPGLYRIVSYANDSKSLATRNYQWTTTADVVLTPTSSQRYTSHYWYIDYERDSNGNPIWDGTYTIQLFSTDKLYLHPKAHSVSPSSDIEIYRLDRDNVLTEKWFINPTRDGTGTFYILNAANPNLYLHLKGHSAADNTQLELLEYDDYYKDGYRWTFQAVTIIPPFASGTQKVKSGKNNSLYLHIESRSSQDGQPLELYPYEAAHEDFYNWSFIKQDDGTFFIKNTATGLYMHPTGHSTNNGTRIQQLTYDSAYAPYYKWIVVPGSQTNSFKIISVADPRMFLHSTGHTAVSSNQVEILYESSEYQNTYEWILQ